MHHANFGLWGRLLLLAVLFCCTSALAQDSSSSAIRGTITDASSARIPVAQVAAINVGTGVTRSVESDTLGYFALEMLPPGEYYVRVIAPGMAKQEQQVQIEIGAAINLDFTLQPASVRTTGPIDAVSHVSPWER